MLIIKRLNPTTLFFPFQKKMGCCVSKCNPDNPNSIEEELNHVEDKLVISPPKPQFNINNNFPLSNKLPPISNKISPFPPSPSNSSSTSSIYTVSSCSSLSSTTTTTSSSSVFSLKDRSFSNEFLTACYEKNPHIVRINSIKELATFPPGANLLKQTYTTPQRVINGSTSQKRVRSSSPGSSLRRQKSFRREPEKINPVTGYSLSSGRISPSRRFNGDFHYSGRISGHKGLKDQFCSKRVVDSKVRTGDSVSSSLRRQDSFRPASPGKISSNVATMRPCLRNRETCVHRISSKIDEDAVGEAFLSRENDLMEDIEDPLISFDCFIFPHVYLNGLASS